MADLYALVEQSVAGLGVEVVDVERAGKGLLRVTIDREDGGARIEDCEAVSRQLSRVFEVENIEYARLEVGTPGTDRPLRRESDFRRFAGERVEIKLREALAGRKVYAGILRAPEDLAEEGAPAPAEGEAPVFGIEIDEPKTTKAKKATQGETQVLNFTLDEIERAKLDPVLDFKGRKR